MSAFIQTIKTKEIPELQESLNFQICKIETGFDIKKIQSLFEEAMVEVQPVKKDSYNTYWSIGLQFKNPQNPLYDAVPSLCDIYVDPKTGRARLPMDLSVEEIRSIYQEYYGANIFNPVGEKFKFVNEFFNSAGVQLVRGKILIAKPTHKLPWHTDSPRDMRIHLPIYSHPDAVMLYENREYYLEADGSVYLANTSIPHSIRNSSSIDRIHAEYTVFDPHYEVVISKFQKIKSRQA